MAADQPSSALREKVRSARGRASTPSTVIVDSQLIETTQVAQKVGYDGAELIKGHKRHILVRYIRVVTASLSQRY